MMKKRRRGQHPDKQTVKAAKARFLDHFARTANVTQSCAISRIGRATVYEWRDDDPAFATAWSIAEERGTASLEDEAIHRAKVGVSEPVYYKGEIVGYVRKPSDGLLIFMLKARKPDVYKDRVDVHHTLTPEEIAFKKLVFGHGFGPGATHG